MRHFRMPSPQTLMTSSTINPIPGIPVSRSTYIIGMKEVCVIHNLAMRVLNKGVLR